MICWHVSRNTAKSSQGDARRASRKSYADVEDGCFADASGWLHLVILHSYGKWPMYVDDLWWSTYKDLVIFQFATLNIAQWPRVSHNESILWSTGTDACWPISTITRYINHFLIGVIMSSKSFEFVRYPGRNYVTQTWKLAVSRSDNDLHSWWHFHVYVSLQEGNQTNKGFYYVAKIRHWRAYYLVVMRMLVILCSISIHVWC